MIDIELVFLFFSIIIIIIDTIIIINHLNKSPISELKLIAVSNLFILSSFILQIPLALANYSGNFSNISFISYCVKIGIILLILGGFLWLLAILLANFTISYKDITLLILVTFIFFATASFNYLGTGVLLSSHIARFHFEKSGLISFIVAIFTLAFIFIFKIIQFKPNPKVNFHYRLYIFFLGFASIVSINLIILSVEPPTQVIPNFTAFLFGSITILFTGLIIAKHEELFFKSNTTLDSVMINALNSTETFFMTYTDPDSLGTEFVSEILLKLSLSLPELLMSHKKVEYINFGDKSIFFTSGKYIATIMIVGENTFITSSISKFLTKKFERKYEKYLKEVTESKIQVDKSIFTSFKEETDNIQRFFLKNFDKTLKE